MSDPLADLSRSLDVFGQKPGSILIRTTEGWRALPPGEIGQVLAIGEDGLPSWFWRDDLPTAP